MGWGLPSHIDSGLVFIFLGIWHIVNTLHLYIISPRSFRSRAWFPTTLPGSLRCMELWILLAIVLFFITHQLSYAKHDMTSGVIESYHLERFQHAAFSMFYLVYIVVALVNATTTFLPLPDGALQATFGLGFLMEIVIFHLGHHPGHDLESHVHLLMELILAALVLLMALEIRSPQSPLVAVGRAMCLLFKGTWFFHIGLLINVPSAVPMGCAIAEGHAFPQCSDAGDEARAKAIQVLVFCSQAVGIVVSTFTAYALLRTAVRFLVDAKTLEEMDQEDLRAGYSALDDPEKMFDLQVAGSEVPVLKSLSRSLSRRSGRGTPVTPHPSSPLEALGTPLSQLSLVSMPKNLKNV